MEPHFSWLCSTELQADKSSTRPLLILLVDPFCFQSYPSILFRPSGIILSGFSAENMFTFPFPPACHIPAPLHQSNTPD